MVKRPLIFALQALCWFLIKKIKALLLHVRGPSLPLIFLSHFKYAYTIIVILKFAICIVAPVKWSALSVNITSRPHNTKMTHIAHRHQAPRAEMVISWVCPLSNGYSTFNPF